MCDDDNKDFTAGDRSGDCDGSSGDCSGSCDDRSGSASGSCRDDDGRERGRRRRRRRRERLIPVGRIEVDCTPVTFRTPGQAMNILSCAVDQVVTVPITRTVNVQTPTDFGCFLCTPVTETIQVPVTTTVNLPPVLTPVPRIVCPPDVFPTFCPPCG